MTSPISVTNPGEIAKNNRRKNLKSVYSSKEWEKACDEVLNRGHIIIGKIIRGEGLQVGEAGMLVWESLALLEAKVPCEWHLEKANMVVKVGTLFHHSYLESYKDGSYLSLKSIGGKVLCSSCHYAIHNELDLCKCGKYMRRGADMCRACFDKAHPEIVESRKQKERAAKALKERIKADKRAERERYKIDHPKSKAPCRNPSRGQRQ